MADFILNSLRGGMNNSDPAISLTDDQATLAQNVEWVESNIAERRLGSTAVTLSAGMSAMDRVTFLFRDLPTDDETAARLWVFGVTGTSSSSLEYKDTTWHTPTLKDAFTITGNYPNRIAAASLHGKTFLAYKSAVDRLHVYDGSTVRRTGFAEPGAPAVNNTAPAGTYAGDRWARVRVIEMSGSTVLRRSEPSDATKLSPTGANTGMVVTIGTVPGEGETHWEVELSLDNANFYRVSQVVIATATYVDTAAYTAGYTAGTLSEDTGDYALIGSARYLVVDDDRLVWLGNHESATLASRFGWTPVNAADGVGNDERFETDTDPYKDLDPGNGGGISGVSRPQHGTFYIFKTGQIHKAVRSGIRTAAYDTIPETKESGAIHGSVVDGVDQGGNPATYFIDPKVGPRRINQHGIADCGWDIRNTWKTLNLDATSIATAALYYPDKHQVHWWIATGTSNVPDTHIVLHTRFTRDAAEGVRRGWAIWTGDTAVAQCAVLFATNIATGAARSLRLVPFIGMAGHGLVHRCDTGNDDNGTAYTALVRSKPFTPATILRKFAAVAGALFAKAVAGAKVNIRLRRDRGLETTTFANVSLAPTASEDDVIVQLDSLRMSEARVIEIEVTDATSLGTAQWHVSQIALKEQAGQSA